MSDTTALPPRSPRDPEPGDLASGTAAGPATALRDEAHHDVDPAAPRSVRRTVALVLVAGLGMYIMMLTVNTALSLRIASIDPAQKEAVFGRAVSLSALVMLVTIPLGGALSDRTTSRFGRRRPWILGSLVVALLSMAVIGSTDSFALITFAYVIGIVAAQNAFSTYAVIPVEGVPDRLRARVMGLMGMFGALAMSAGSYLAAALVGIPVALMVVPVLLAALTTIPLLVMYKDPVKAAADVPPLDLRAMFSGMVVSPRRHPDFAWAWFSRFLAGIAMTAMFSFFIFYLMDGLNLPIAQAGASAGTLSLASAPVSILFFTVSGWLSDKLGRRKPFVALAAILMAIALVVAATSTTFTQFLVAWLIFAMGQAMYLTVDLALCAAVLPDARDAGKDMAVFQLALSLPNIIVPALAPAVLAMGAGHNYLLLWGGAAVLCAIGALTVFRIRGVR